MNDQKIKIIGGGFSGLVQAFYLCQAGYSVEILEKEQGLGGLLGSVKQENFLVETAANAFIANRELETIASVIEVPLIKKKPEASKRFIFRDRRMNRWPLNFRESLPLLSFMIARKLKSKKIKVKSDENLRDWGFRVIGESATTYLLEPAVQGVFASTAENLDAEMVLQSLLSSHPKGALVGSVSPEGGMQEWIDGMKKYLLAKGVEIKTSCNSQEFDFSQAFIFAVGLNQLKEFCNEQKVPVHKSVLETSCSSLTSVTLAFNDKSMRLNDGFGCLFPQTESFNSLGVLFNHSLFPGRADTGSSETWILNDQNMDFSRMSKMALLRYIRSDRSVLDPKWKEPDLISVSQWPERIPLYNSQLARFNEEHKKESSPFLLVGNYLGDLGLSKIVFKAKENVEKIQGGFFG